MSDLQPQKTTSGLLCLLTLGTCFWLRPSGAVGRTGGVHQTAAHGETLLFQSSERWSCQGRPVRFAGQVSRGQEFKKQLGQDLIFRLKPTEFGWLIAINSKTIPGNDHSSPATPPSRGINPLQIDGWHFRNSDNSGPNDEGPKNVNAPQEVREFNFFVTEADFRAGHDAIQKLLWPAKHAEDELAEARNTYSRLKPARARLTIQGLTLGNLVVGEKAWFVRMDFDAEFCLPSDSRAK